MLPLASVISALLLALLTPGGCFVHPFGIATTRSSPPWVPVQCSIAFHRTGSTRSRLMDHDDDANALDSGGFGSAGNEFNSESEEPGEATPLDLGSEDTTRENQLAGEEDLHRRKGFEHTEGDRAPGSGEDASDEDDDWDSDEHEGIYYEEHDTDDGGMDDDQWDDNESYPDVPLQDDPDDPNYNAQKKLVEETVARRLRTRRGKEFDAFDYIRNNMTEEQIETMNNHPLIKETERLAEDLIVIDEEDIDKLNVTEELAKVTDIVDDPFPHEGKDDILGTGISDDDLVRLDQAYRDAQKTINSEPWDKVSFKAETTDISSLSNQTIQEMNACLYEIGGSSYNCTRWLLYDLDFNVSNLMLAAVKHNPEAPILLQHWFPQLLTYERYQRARDQDFDFTWEDVENADVKELERYFLGFGYTEIPKKAPGETGIIELGYLDEEEERLAAFENWFIDVYNPVIDKKDFGDDNFRDEDNIFSHFYKQPKHPDVPTFDDAQLDLKALGDELGESGEAKEYKDFIGQAKHYERIGDENVDTDYRGHLVVACADKDEDVEIAEKITLRMAEEFGEKVHVETRIMPRVAEDDYVFEVWLESYNIDLLHSKRKASLKLDGWTGPVECDDQQIEYLVEEVRFLTSDDARYSYRLGEYKSDL